MEKYLEDSLALITSALENEDPDKLLSDFLAFEKNAVGPTCDEMNIQYNINFSKISNKVFTINDFMVTGHHFSDLSTISFNDLEKFINDFKTYRLLKNTEKIYDNIVYFDSYEEARVLQNYYIRYMITKINTDIRQIKNTLLNQENKLLNFLDLLDKQ